MRSMISYNKFNRKWNYISKHLINQYWVKKNGVKKDNINFKKSMVLQRFDDNREIMYVETSFEEFFDCNCKRRNGWLKRDHYLPNCNMYKHRMYKKLKWGELMNMNNRGSKVKYDSFKWCYTPNYTIYYWVKRFTWMWVKFDLCGSLCCKPLDDNWKRNYCVKLIYK